MVPSCLQPDCKGRYGRVRLITQQTPYRHAWHPDHCPLTPLHLPLPTPAILWLGAISPDQAMCPIPCSHHAEQRLAVNPVGADTLIFLNWNLTFQLSERKERNSEVIRWANIVMITTPVNTSPFKNLNPFLNYTKSIKNSSSSRRSWKSEMSRVSWNRTRKKKKKYFFICKGELQDIYGHWQMNCTNCISLHKESEVGANRPILQVRKLKEVVLFAPGPKMHLQ